MTPLNHYLILSAMLFSIGAAGVFMRRNLITILLSIEIMLNAVNLIFVTADVTVPGGQPHAGAVFALFVIVLAAAEVGVGLAIVLQFYRLRKVIAVDEVALDAEKVAQ